MGPANCPGRAVDRVARKGLLRWLTWNTGHPLQSVEQSDSWQMNLDLGGAEKSDDMRSSKLRRCPEAYLESSLVAGILRPINATLEQENFRKVSKLILR